jgi:hypothetical protein
MIPSFIRSLPSFVSFLGILHFRPSFPSFISFLPSSREAVAVNRRQKKKKHFSAKRGCQQQQQQQQLRLPATATAAAQHEEQHSVMGQWQALPWSFAEIYCGVE